MLVSELPNGRLLEATSLIELRVAPRRLTIEIAAFVDDVLEAARGKFATTRVLSAHSPATLTRRMSSRQEEKERRKRERQEREAAEQAQSARRKRMQVVFGGGLAAVALVAVVVIVVVVACSAATTQAPTRSRQRGAAIPAQKESDLKKAAAAAGCKLVDAAERGRGPRGEELQALRLQAEPADLRHPLPDLVRRRRLRARRLAGARPLVHTLEHGRIDIQYKPGTPATTVAQLETFVKELDDGYHMLLFENTTKMPFAVAATAWDHQLGCTTMNPKVFDAIRAFRTEHIDKGPEVVP